MPIEKKVAEIENLVGGLDTFVSESEIDDSATPDCENVIPTGRGAIETRPGRTAHGGEIIDIADVQIHNMDSVDANGTWSGVGGATNVAANTTYKKEGSAGIYFDITATSTGPYITNNTMTPVDLSVYEDTGKIRAWIYFSSVVNLTAVYLYWGSVANNWWLRNPSVDYLGGSLSVGWNLMEFDWATATKNGTPDSSATDEVSVYLHYAGAGGAAADSFCVVDDIRMYTSTTIAGQGIYTYITATDVEELIIVGGVLYKKTTNTWTEITGGNFSTTARVCAAQVGSRLYFADGATALCYYNGTNIVTTGVASAPLPSFLIFYNRRLYCNDVNNPDRYYFGGAIDPTTGAATNTGNFGSGTPYWAGYAGFGLGKEVVGFGKLGSSYLVVLLKDGIHRIAPTASTGSTNVLTHSEEMVSNSIGGVSHASVDNIENDLGFLSWGDFYLLGEVASYSALRTRTISTKISSLIAGVSAANISKACAIYSPAEKQLYLAYADGTDYNNAVLVYSVYYKSWWKYTNWHAAGFAEFIDGDERYLVYVSDYAYDPYCYQVNTTANDAGSAISWYWKSKVFDLGGFDIQKKFKRWALLFGYVFGTMTIDVYIGGDTNTTTSQLGSKSGSAGMGSVVMGSVAMGADVNSLVLSTIANDWRWKRISRPNESTTIQFKFSGSGVGEAGSIEKIKFYYLENKNKKDRTRRIT